MSRVNSCWPSAACTAPLLVPVPKASRVACTFERPSTTVSVAVRLAADSGRIPVVAMAPAARPVLRKLRRVIELIVENLLIQPNQALENEAITVAFAAIAPSGRQWDCRG